MVAILDLPEVRARVGRWVEVYRQPINGVYLDRRTYARGEAIDCASVEGGPMPVETWFA